MNAVEHLEQTRFVFQSAVYFDELDPQQLLHNARYAVHVERATSALYGSLGFVWEVDLSKNPDQFHVVREFSCEFLAPFRGTGVLDVGLWVQALGSSSCTYGFECGSIGRRVVLARGRRTIVKLDPTSLRPSPWTDAFRARHASLMAGGAG